MAEKLRAKVLKEGYLFKAPQAKGVDQFRKGWQHRYFTLQGRYLYYYDKKGDLKCKDKVELASAIIREASDITGEEYTFKIAMAKQNFLYLKASSQAEMDEWMQLMLKSGASLQRSDGRIVSKADAAIVAERAVPNAATQAPLENNMVFEPTEFQLAGRACWGIMFKDSYDDLYHSRIVVVLDVEDESLTLIKDGSVFKTIKLKTMDNVVHATKAEDRLPSGKKLLPLYFKVLKSKAVLRSYKLELGTAKDVKEIADYIYLVNNSDPSSILLKLEYPPIIFGMVEVRLGDSTNRWSVLYAVVDTGKIILYPKPESRYPLWVASLEQAVIDRDEKLLIDIDGPLVPLSLRFRKPKTCSQWLKALRLAQKSYEDRVIEQFKLDNGIADEDEPEQKQFPPPPIGLADDDDLPDYSQSPRMRLGLPNFVHGDSFVASWGCGKEGQLGNRTKDDNILPASCDFFNSKKVRWLSASKYSQFAMALTSDGSIYSWGKASVGELGIGEGRNKNSSPVLINLNNIRVLRVSCGAYHVVALTFSAEAYSWGEGRYGQLGTGLTENYFYPQKIDEFGSRRIKGVFAGGNHSAALLEDSGELYTWGLNDKGQLGLRDTENRLTPVACDLHRQGQIAKVALGFDFSAALLASGSVYTWGSGERGKTGHRDCVDRVEPRRISYFQEHGIICDDIDCGESHMLAVSSQGVVYSWGSFEYNALRKRKDKHHPSKIKPLKPYIIKSVIAGAKRSFFIDENGNVFAQGANSNGELGLGRVSRMQEFGQTMLRRDLEVVQVCSGYDFTFALINCACPQTKIFDTEIRVNLDPEKDIVPSAPESQIPHAAEAIGKVLDMAGNLQAQSEPMSPPLDEKVVEPSLSNKVDKNSDLNEEALSWRKVIVDNTTQKSYYYNKVTKVRKWDKDMPLDLKAIIDQRPAKFAPGVGEPKDPSISMPKNLELSGELPLPEGWKSAIDAKSGKTYYYNTQLNETRWTRPT